MLRHRRKSISPESSFLLPVTSLPTGNDAWWKKKTFISVVVAVSTILWWLVCLLPQRSPERLLETQLLNLPCPGKLPILKILADAGALTASNVSQQLCRTLPSWKQVVSLYGPDPVVLGLETCAQYRSLFTPTSAETPRRPLVRIAGLYNSGTNLFGHLLNLNLENLGHQQMYDVVRLLKRWKLNSVFAFLSM
jgi:hypothetical protein